MKTLLRVSLMTVALVAGSMTSGCMTTKPKKQTVYKDPVGKLKDYSLFKKGDVDRRILRKGRKNMYTQALDSF